MQSMTTIDLIIFSCCAIILGIYMLVKGGDWTIDGASHIANKLGISPLVIAFTVVAFGTSLPELIVSINAAAKGSPGIAIGNVVGSNIANILLILGAASAICAFKINWKTMRNDFIMMVLSSIVMIFFLHQGMITRIQGSIMFAILLIYVVVQIYFSQKNKVKVALDDKNKASSFSTIWMAFLFVLLGLTGLAVGADILVRGAVKLAELANIPDAVIGMTIIAIGTSLPELTVAITASRKGKNEMVIGNVVGSNVFNILCILGLTATIKPLPIAQTESLGIYFMIATVTAFSLWALAQPRINRVTGVIMLVIYGLFLGWQY